MEGRVSGVGTAHAKAWQREQRQPTFIWVSVEFKGGVQERQAGG